MKRVLDLTDREWELLIEVLNGHQDEGPVVMNGWRSRALKALSAKVEEQMEAQPDSEESGGWETKPAHLPCDRWAG